MLVRCGVEQLDDLYADVDPALRLKQPYNLPEGMDETSVRRFFDEIAEKNLQVKACFAGAGFYDHAVPAAVKSIAARSEFLTAYTPYQPEISQGTLQYIFEYQTMMARLTGMEVSNASMYDGATSTAEAVMMAVASQRKRNLVLVSETLAPAVRRVVDTYAHYHGIDLLTIPAVDGETSREALQQMLELHNKDVAAVLVPSPNYFGIIENHNGLADLCHSFKALLIVNCIASDLAVLKTPGELGADIACGDAQSLGIPLSFGGPYLGFLCCTKALMRKMPGRIVGATTDSEGRRCFVLTLQAREQHIRREKATSNICSNQGLMTLWVSIYMALTGADGLREIAQQSRQTAQYLLQKMTSDGRARLRYPSKPFLNEFLLETDYSVDSLISACIRQGKILPGVKVDDHAILMAATEMQTREDVDRLFEIAETCV
jgi:glycine dehydrogenase subunit 1